MNILVLNLAPNNPAMASDYQIDMLFHGLRETDNFVYDWPRMNHMYKDYPKESLEKMWGKGWFYGCMDDRAGLTDQEIEDKEWDYVVVPIHHTRYSDLNFFLQLINRLLDRFTMDQICIVDGHDQQNHFKAFEDMVEKGLKYFKRECTDFGIPIHFGIQEDKIMTPKSVKEKTTEIAPLIPVNSTIDESYRKTYIYNTEEDYMNMYHDSMFALTSKKGGWDTLRHYEILAAGCLPYFVDIENCPENTMKNWQKDTLSYTKRRFPIDWNFIESVIKTIKPEYMAWPHCGIVNIDNPGQLSDFSDIDELWYEEIVLSQQRWLRDCGTTKAIALQFIKDLK